MEVCPPLAHILFYFATDNSQFKLNSSDYGTLENFSKEQRYH